MIIGYTTITKGEYSQNIQIKVDESLRKIEIIMQVVSPETILYAKQIYPGGFERVVFVSENGSLFTLERVLLFQLKTNFQEYIFTGKYETLIIGESLYSKGFVRVRINNLEKVFSDVESYENDCSERHGWYAQIIDKQLYLLHKLENIHNISAFRDLLRKTRECFEFLMEGPIIFDEVSFIETVDDVKQQAVKGHILYDVVIYEEPTKSVDFSNISNKGKRIKELEECLEKWLEKYDIYHEVIGIWRKTIHCIGASEEDIFIWRCQSFELLCTLYPQINEKAKQYMREKQTKPNSNAYPNICDFLKASNDEIHYLYCEDKVFYEVKNARDIYTHYNPKKNIGELAWKNSIHIIKVSLNRTIEHVLSIERIIKNDFFLMIQPPTNDKLKRSINVEV